METHSEYGKNSMNHADADFSATNFGIVNVPLSLK